MAAESLKHLFSPEAIREIFPRNRADDFFDALYGDPSEGAYDIHLVFKEQTGDALIFEFQLTRRPEKCLRCSLTYGLPQVFARHPVINVKELVQRINARLDGQGTCGDWRLERTREISEDLHVIPLVISLKLPEVRR
jgi:hypothetical protein